MTNYTRGYIAERLAFKELMAAGYYVMRASGSHTIFDLIAVNHSEIRMIQLKRCKKELRSFKKELEGIKEFTNCPPNAIKELWIRLDQYKHRKPHWEIITI